MSNVKVIETTSTVTLSNDDWEMLLYLLSQKRLGVHIVWHRIAAAIEEQTGLET